MAWVAVGVTAATAIAGAVSSQQAAKDAKNKSPLQGGSGAGGGNGNAALMSTAIGTAGSIAGGAKTSKANKAAKQDNYMPG